MAYDLSGSRSGHHAQLYPSSSKEDDSSSASGAVSYLLARGVPSRKILLGIPVFGRRGTSGGGGGGSSSGGGSDGRVDYRHLPRRGTKEQVDKRACAAYCVGGGSGFVSYDNPDTVKMKAVFVKQKGLGVRLTTMNLLLARSVTFWGGGEPHETNMHRCDRASFISPDRRTRKTASGAWWRRDSRRCTALGEGSVFWELWDRLGTGGKCSWDTGKGWPNHYGSIIFILILGWEMKSKNDKKKEGYEQTVRTRFGENRQKRRLHGRHQKRCQRKIEITLDTLDSQIVWKREHDVDEQVGPFFTVQRHSHGSEM